MKKLVLLTALLFAACDRDAGSGLPDPTGPGVMNPNGKPTQVVGDPVLPQTMFAGDTTDSSTPADMAVPPIYCGGLGQECCVVEGPECAADLDCVNGTCREPEKMPPCGDLEGQECCDGSLCFNGLICYQDTCETVSTTCSEDEDPNHTCSLTHGYYKNHTCWPADYLYLGNTVYNQIELEAILNAPSNGNGLTSLAHQLIAAKLNMLAGAHYSALGTAITDADLLIGNLVMLVDYLDPSVTTDLVSLFDSFNSGLLSAPHCQ